MKKTTTIWKKLVLNNEEESKIKESRRIKRGEGETHTNTMHPVHIDGSNMETNGREQTENIVMR